MTSKLPPLCAALQSITSTPKAQTIKYTELNKNLILYLLRKENKKQSEKKRKNNKTEKKGVIRGHIDKEKLKKMRDEVKNINQCPIEDFQIKRLEMEQSSGSSGVYVASIAPSDSIASSTVGPSGSEPSSSSLVQSVAFQDGAQVEQESPMYEMYRARNGRLYFHNRESGQTCWDEPPPGARSTNMPVNDISSWQSYRSDSNSGKAAKVYFVNSQTGETTWHTPPDCGGKLPTNDAKAWLEYKDSDRNRKYYFNKMSHEKTWYRPPELGLDPDGEVPLDEYLTELREQEEREREDINLVDDDGDEFVIPEGFDDEYDDEYEDDEDDYDLGDDQDVQTGAGVDNHADEHGSYNATLSNAQKDEDIHLETTAKENDDSFGAKNQAQGEADDDDKDYEEEIARERQLEVAREIELEGARNAYLGKQRKLFRDDYIKMLEEKGIQPYSQWENWIPKLELDDRFNRVDIEDRSRLFNEYRIGLIGQEVKTRKIRARRCLRYFKRLKQRTPRIYKALISTCSKLSNSGSAENAVNLLQKIALGQEKSDEKDISRDLDELERKVARKTAQALSILPRQDQKAIIFAVLKF